MECKKRNLNPHETYACSIKDVKSLFGNEDNVYVSFGYLGRKFKFDSSEPERRKDGIIVASASINKRFPGRSRTWKRETTLLLILLQKAGRVKSL